MTGINRNVYHKINKLLESFPAVAILGARQVGKTTLAKQLRPNWHYVDIENPDDFDLISQDPVFFFERHPKQLIIDEAQDYPAIFNVLRGVIDKQRTQCGRFIITGSSSPELIKHVSESLAGRVAIVELGTLKTNEQCAKPLSPFYQLFENKLEKTHLPETEAPLTRDQLHHAWLKGGYPEIATSQSEHFIQEWMNNYQQTYLNRDIAKHFPKLNKLAYRRFLQMLSKLSGTIINKSNTAQAIEMSESTVRDYLNIAQGTFLWRMLTSFEHNITKSIIKMPKGHICDSGLLHHLLKIDDLEDLYSSPYVGHSFEGFVIEELIKGLQASHAGNWDVHYYRTRNGAEIDCIIHGSFGVLPIEIKYGTKTNLKQLRTLETFVETHQLGFGLLINQSEQPQWLSRRIFQLPAGWL